MHYMPKKPFIRQTGDLEVGFEDISNIHENTLCMHFHNEKYIQTNTQTSKKTTTISKFTIKLNISLH